jgi:hypothetical protein
MRRGYGMMAAAAAMLFSPAAIVEPLKQSTRKRIQIASQLPQSNLNRSRHWDYAATYKDARMISPFPQRPVR